MAIDISMDGMAILDAEAHRWSVAVGDGTDGGARFEIHM
jgi:hypothetical protein